MSPASKPAQAAPGAQAACLAALDRDLGWALGVVFRSYVKAATVAFADVPGGSRGYQILAVVTQGEPGSQLELAQHLGVDRTVMTYLLDDLERAALVERSPDPADRRARRVTATARGRELRTDLDRRLCAAENEVLGGLAGDADRQLFRELLRRLATHADAQDHVPDVCAAAESVRGTQLGADALDRAGT